MASFGFDSDAQEFWDEVEEDFTEFDPYNCMEDNDLDDLDDDFDDDSDDYDDNYNQYREYE